MVVFRSRQRRNRRINKKIISEQKKLSRAEEGLSVFEQLREEAEKQEKAENVKEIKETDDLRKQPLQQVQYQQKNQI